MPKYRDILGAAEIMLELAGQLVRQTIDKALRIDEIRRDITDLRASRDTLLDEISYRTKGRGEATTKSAKH